MSATLLVECLARLQIADRNPTFREFEQSAPAYQRAIMERWNDIIDGPVSEFKDMRQVAVAMGRRQQAIIKVMGGKNVG